MTRLEQIQKEIDSIQHMNVYAIKSTSEEVLKFYKQNEQRLNELPQNKFDKWSAISEVLGKCELKEKLSKVKSILLRVIRLERHAYAPEMNKLHFSHTMVNIPQMTSIEDAVKHVVRSMSIDQLQSLIHSNKIMK